MSLKIVRDSEEEKKSELEKPSLIIRIGEWIRKRIGTDPSLVGVVDGQTGNAVPEKWFKYNFTINTGAGMLRGSVDERNAENAKDAALVDYVKNRCRVKVELICEVPAPKPQK